MYTGKIEKKFNNGKSTCTVSKITSYEWNGYKTI